MNLINESSSINLKSIKKMEDLTQQKNSVSNTTASIEKVVNKSLIQYISGLSAFKKEATLKLVNGEFPDSLALKYAERNSMCIRVARAHVSRAEMGLGEFLYETIDKLRKKKIVKMFFQNDELYVMYDSNKADTSDYRDDHDIIKIDLVNTLLMELNKSQSN